MNEGWPVAFQKAFVGNNFYIFYDEDLSGPYNNTILTLENFLSKEELLPLRAWTEQLQNEKFEEISKLTLVTEDPFAKRRKGLPENSKYFKNETKCFIEIQNIYERTRPGEDDYLISVLKFPKNLINEKYAPRLWGYTIKDRNSSIPLYFVPIMFDINHIAWPLKTHNKGQKDLCNKACPQSNFFNKKVGCVDSY